MSGLGLAPFRWPISREAYSRQRRAMVEVTARLRAQISVKEVQIGAMRTFAAERNPELLMVRQELEALKRELSRIEGSSPAAAAISKGGEAGEQRPRQPQPSARHEVL